MISLDEQLKGASTAAVCGHVRPDGDAFGSCMGLYLFLKKWYPQIRATVCLEPTYSDTFRFITCSGEMVSELGAQEPFDVFFALDCADIERLGDAQSAFRKARRTVVIDHHISNTGFGMVNEIQPSASSASELVALMIGKDRIDRTVAEPLYLGIAHDTGIFRYSCTSSRTMTVGGWLMDTGIDFTKICDDTFYKKTYHQNQVLGRALTESVLMLDGKVIFSVVRRKDMDLYCVEPKDLDGIVQQLRVTEGAEAAVFLYETGDQEYKVSMRSNGKVDVAAVSACFAGGGHKMAAGCTVKGTAQEAVSQIVDRIAEQL